MIGDSHSPTVKTPGSDADGAVFSASMQAAAFIKTRKVFHVAILNKNEGVSHAGRVRRWELSYFKRQ